MRINTAKFFINLTIISIVLFLFQSCNVITGSVGSGGVSTGNNPQYIEEKIVNQGLAISLPPTQVIIGNGDDVTDDLGAGNPKEVYLNFFREQFPKAIAEHSTFKKVIPFTSKYGIELDKNFILRTHVMGTNSFIKIHEPKKGAKISTGDNSVRFILFIEGLKISRVTELESRADSSFNRLLPNELQQKGVTIYPKLSHKLNYSLWDNEKEMTVTFGSIEEKDDAGLKMEKIDWQTILESIVKDIVKGTQFAK